MAAALVRASQAPDAYLFSVCLLACLLADIADKQQDAGQSVRVQISASLAGGRSAYQHRYAALNSVPCILSVQLTCSNRDNTSNANGFPTNSIYCFEH